MQRLRHHAEAYIKKIFRDVQLNFLYQGKELIVAISCLTQLEIKLRPIGRRIVFQRTKLFAKTDKREERISINSHKGNKFRL